LWANNQVGRKLTIDPQAERIVLPNSGGEGMSVGLAYKAPCHCAKTERWLARHFFSATPYPAKTSNVERSAVPLCQC
jgi:hypothetical protein